MNIFFLIIFDVQKFGLKMILFDKSLLLKVIVDLRELYLEQEKHDGINDDY